MGQGPLAQRVGPPSPDVSAVITCYNQGRFVGEAIASVVRQRPREIIVVDDGSVDDTASVVARFPQAQYIKQANGGVVPARNRGLGECRGQYVLFLDGDDILLCDALETGARLLDSAPELGFVYGRCQMVDAKGTPQAHISPASDADDLYDALLRRNDIWMPGQVMHRRAAIQQLGGFDASADHSSDLDLYLRLAREFGGRSHTRIVAHWRQHGSNTSRRHALMLRSILQVVRQQRPYVDRHPVYRSAYESGLDRYRTYYGTLVLDDVREDIRARQNWRRAATGTLALARYAPGVLARYVGARLSRLVGADRRR